MTEKEILHKLTALCARGEHCTYEMREKMRKWDTDLSIENRIIDYLVREKYVDDCRYARVFAMDRIKSNKWGRRKVEQAMYQKRLSKDIIRETLDNIDDDIYLDILRPLLKSKRRSIKAANPYEANGKLIRFALGRGFTMDLIRQCIDDVDNYEIEEDGED